MNVKIVFDFHDIFVDSNNAWKKAFKKMTKDDEVVDLYNKGVSKKEICKKYKLEYDKIEEEYRKDLKPIEKNIEFAKNISKIYPITIVSMARADRVMKDIEKFNLKNVFSEIYTKEKVKNRSEFLKKLSIKHDWLLFFNHEINKVEIDEKVIYFPINFQGDISKFEKISFTEHAKTKLIYNELSDIYLQSIANDTTKETILLDNILKKYHQNQCILDCCCGVGRHCRALAERGYKVTGIDISKKQIENAKKINGIKNITYFNMDVRNIELEKKDFNAAICMWTTYNYLSQDVDLKKFIEGVYYHLKDGGIFILDSKNIPAMEKNRVYKRNTKTKNLDLELLICKRIIRNIQNSQYFYFMNKNGKKEFYMDEEFVRFYYLDEIREIIKNYFDIIDVFGDFDMSAYKEKISKRFIIVLRKIKENKNENYRKSY